MRSRPIATVGGWAVALLLVFAAAPGVLAQASLDERDLALLGAPTGRPLAGAELEEATQEVASLMRCPSCQGLSVAASHTEAAQAMRSKAAALLAKGYSDDQVLSYFEGSYGEFIRLSPRPEGFNLLVWWLPAAGLLVGILVIWGRLRRGTPQVDETVVDPDDDELAAYRERVRREVDA